MSILSWRQFDIQNPVGRARDKSVKQRENRRSPRRIALPAIVIIGVVCLVGYVVANVNPFARHRRVAHRMDVAVLRLAENCPAQLTDDPGPAPTK